MRLVYGEDERCLAWVTKTLGRANLFSDAKAIGLEGENGLLAVCAYDRFTDCDVSMHIASNGSGHWLTRAFLVAGFSYPFVQLGLRRITGLVPSKNKRALRFNRRLGFKVEGMHRLALPDDDLVILGMLKSECPFIPPEYRHD